MHSSEDLFFSVIIPVFNGLSHDLPKCLDSIWRQNINKSFYEVLCVDDCSNDGTREWLKTQQNSHPNLVLVENEVNIRQGGSRNNGFRRARGKYIMLIDQDDYYDKNVFEKIYTHLNSNDLEILVVDCTYQYPGKENNVLQHNFPYTEIMTGDEMIEKNSIPYAPWKFIFLRSHIINNKLYFEENERIEDVDWVHKLVHFAKRVQYQPILFIHYNKSSISTTMSSYKTGETVYSTLRMALRLGILADTLFKSSSIKLQNYIISLERKFNYIGLRSYLFFYEKTSIKASNIKKNFNQSNRHKNLNRLVIFAIAYPNFFSFCSNLLVPFSRILLKVYRGIKYR